MKKILSFLLTASVVFTACSGASQDIIFDSDANNELDDQHAIAYLLMNQDYFNVLAITTNATRVGGDAAMHAVEAQRIVHLMGDLGKDIPILPGATGKYEEIHSTLASERYDGWEAVDFIIDAARKHSAKKKLLLVPVGKLTNIALALEKAPDIADKVKILWLGSNYPRPGEYNLDNDIPSMNYVLEQNVETEFALVDPQNGMTATAQVCVTRGEVKEKFVGKGPKVQPIVGRQGGMFNCFGDYSLNLFDQCSKDDNYKRALFDMAALSLARHPEWAEEREIPAPTMVDKNFAERPSNEHKIKIRYNFNRDAIIEDFTRCLDEATPKSK